MLGLDCDSGLIVYLFDECDEVVKVLFLMVIWVVKKCGKYVGICG